MDLSKVDEQRQTLERNLQELRQSLKHWQLLDAEYEGLKEAVTADPTEVDTAALENIAKTYDGELVDEKTVRELTGLDKDSPRTAQQIVGLVHRRQEYVQTNIDSIQRRFFEAEAKLEEFDFAASRDSETGLPLTEIHEELDEDDNVISSSLSNPEDSQNKLIESLRKAGLTKDDLGIKSADQPEPVKPAITNAVPQPPVQTREQRANSASSLHSANGDSANDFEGPDRQPTRKKSVSFAADTKESPEMSRVDSEDGRKSVSFADKVAVAPSAALPDVRSVSFSPRIEEIPPQPLGPPSPLPDDGFKLNGADPAVSAPLAQAGAAMLSPAQNDPKSDLQKDLRASFKPGDKVLQINDDEEVEATHFVLPENESEDDARMRREMLDYSMNEVGHIVAHMDLDGDGYNDEDEDEDDGDTSSHYTASTHADNDEEDTPYTSGHSDHDDYDEDEDEEDEFGRTKRRVVTDQYRQEMLDMEQRLIGNIGPLSTEDNQDPAGMEVDAKDVRKIVIRGNDAKRESVSSASSGDNADKKASSKKRVSFAEGVDVAAEPATGALKSQKLEANANAAPVSSTIAERSVDETPTGPPGQILADTLVERPAGTSAHAAPPSEDDPVMQRRELAAEYYRRRNDLIKQQGGFKRDEDDEEANGELMEERDGKLKKVSRFRAARMKAPM